MTRRDMLVSAAGGLVAGAAAPDERSRPLRAMRVRIPEEKIVDLKARLERTRWPDQVIGAGWDYGTNLGYLEELCRYWARDFDWRGQERSLNRFAHHHTDIDGLRLHYVLQRGRGPSPLPLILFHGWPGSFYQMLKLAPLLADPAGHGGSIEDSFDVVVPSLPGYGFSSRPSQQGWTQRRFARLFATLMTERLGYRRFCAHGGDIGAGVVNQLALQFPGRLHGLHLTNVARPYLGPGSRPLSEAERRLIAQEDAWSAEEGAYADLQRTRPQTPTYGLNDSPAGLASWIVEKWRAWSDCNGDIESVFTKDELLTNISLYWFTETIGSSMRVYYEHRRHAPPLGAGDRITPPAGFALFPRDLSNPPREWAERTYDVASWIVMPRGGHFATMEQPQLVAEDIRRFFRRFR